jgi:hypothetical protein
MAKLPLVEAALVTAAWSDQHGMAITRDNAFCDGGHAKLPVDGH